MEEKDTSISVITSPDVLSPIKKAIELGYDNNRALNRQLESLKSEVKELREILNYARQKMEFPEHSEETHLLARAISKAKIKGLKQFTPSGNSNFGEYETWKDYRLAFSEPLDEEGLTIDFMIQERWGRYVFIARIEHYESKQWKEVVMEFKEEEVAYKDGKIKNPDLVLTGKITSKKRQAYVLLLGI